MNRAMIIIVFMIFMLMSSGHGSYADVLVCREIATGKFIEMQSNASRGTLIQNAVSSGYASSSVEEVVMTANEFKLYMDNQYAPDIATARTQKLAEIASMAQILYNGISLKWGTTAGDVYKAALLATQTQAATDLAGISTIAAVKNYQPIWPAKP